MKKKHKKIIGLISLVGVLTGSVFLVKEFLPSNDKEPNEPEEQASITTPKLEDFYPVTENKKDNLDKEESDGVEEVNNSNKLTPTADGQEDKPAISKPDKTPVIKKPKQEDNEAKKTEKNSQKEPETQNTPLPTNPAEKPPTKEEICRKKYFDLPLEHLGSYVVEEKVPKYYLSTVFQTKEELEKEMKNVKETLDLSSEKEQYEKKLEKKVKITVGYGIRGEENCGFIGFYKINPDIEEGDFWLYFIGSYPVDKTPIESNEKDK